MSREGAGLLWLAQAHDTVAGERRFRTYKKRQLAFERRTGAWREVQIGPHARGFTSGSHLLCRIRQLTRILFASALSRHGLTSCATESHVREEVAMWGVRGPPRGCCERAAATLSPCRLASSTTCHLLITAAVHAYLTRLAQPRRLRHGKLTMPSWKTPVVATPRLPR